MNILLTNIKTNQMYMINTKKYYFKHAWTGNYVNIELNQNTSINNLKNEIDQIIKTNLMVNNDYDIVIAGLILQELANPIDLTLGDKIKSLDSDSFYIIPKYEQIPEEILLRKNFVANLINIQNLECVICYKNFSLVNFMPWKNCDHYKKCCISCTNNWKRKCNENNSNTTCPFCRKNI